MVDHVRKQFPERRRAHGPAVHELDVGSGADTAVGGFPCPDVDEAIRFASEEVGCFGVGQCGHGFLRR